MPGYRVAHAYPQLAAFQVLIFPSWLPAWSRRLKASVTYFKASHPPGSARRPPAAVKSLTAKDPSKLLTAWLTALGQEHASAAPVKLPQVATA